MKTVGILDYGVGNIASLKGALEGLGYKVLIGATETSLSKVTTIFLPGVGSFPFAMDNLRQLGMDKFLRIRFEAQDVEVIGICLGMQLFFEHSEEGDCEGLGLIEGKVKRFAGRECHVGWNIVRPSENSILSKNSGYYFNHSYYVECSSKVTLASSNYQTEFPVLVKENRFHGIQFHPEKSQNTGAQLLKTLIGA